MDFSRTIYQLLELLVKNHGSNISGDNEIGDKTDSPYVDIRIDVDGNTILSSAPNTSSSLNSNAIPNKRNRQDQYLLERMQCLLSQLKENLPAASRQCDDLSKNMNEKIEDLSLDLRRKLRDLEMEFDAHRRQQTAQHTADLAALKTQGPPNLSGCSEIANIMQELGTLKRASLSLEKDVNEQMEAIGCFNEDFNKVRGVVEELKGKGENMEGVMGEFQARIGEVYQGQMTLDTRQHNYEQELQVIREKDLTSIKEDLNAKITNKQWNSFKIKTETSVENFESILNEINAGQLVSRVANIENSTAELTNFVQSKVNEVSSEINQMEPISHQKTETMELKMLALREDMQRQIDGVGYETRANLSVIKDKVGDVEGKVAIATRDYQLFQGEMTTMRSTHQSLNKTTESLTEGQNLSNTRCTNLERSVEKSQRILSEIADTLETVRTQNQTAALESKNEALQTDLNSVKEGLKTELTQFKEQLNTMNNLKSNVHNTQTSVSNLFDELAMLKSNTEASVQDIRQTFDDRLLEHHTTLQQELTSMSEDQLGQIEKNSSKLGAFDLLLSTLRQAVASHGEILSSVESRIDQKSLEIDTKVDGKMEKIDEVVAEKLKDRLESFDKIQENMEKLQKLTDEIATREKDNQAKAQMRDAQVFDIVENLSGSVKQEIQALTSLAHSGHSFNRTCIETLVKGLVGQAQILGLLGDASAPQGVFSDANRHGPFSTSSDLLNYLEKVNRRVQANWSMRNPNAKSILELISKKADSSLLQLAAASGDVKHTLNKNNLFSLRSRSGSPRNSPRGSPHTVTGERTIFNSSSVAEPEENARKSFYSPSDHNLRGANGNLGGNNGGSSRRERSLLALYGDDEKSQQERQFKERLQREQQKTKNRMTDIFGGNGKGNNKNNIFGQNGSSNNGNIFVDKSQMLQMQQLRDIVNGNGSMPLLLEGAMGGGAGGGGNWDRTQHWGPGPGKRLDSGNNQGNNNSNENNNTTNGNNTGSGAFNDLFDLNFSQGPQGNNGNNTNNGNNNNPNYWFESEFNHESPPQEGSYSAPPPPTLTNEGLRPRPWVPKPMSFRQPQPLPPTPKNLQQQFNFNSTQGSNGSNGNKNGSAIEHTWEVLSRIVPRFTALAGEKLEIGERGKILLELVAGGVNAFITAIVNTGIEIGIYDLINLYMFYEGVKSDNLMQLIQREYNETPRSRNGNNVVFIEQATSSHQPPNYFRLPDLRFSSIRGHQYPSPVTHRSASSPPYKRFKSGQKSNTSVQKSQQKRNHQHHHGGFIHQQPQHLHSQNNTPSALSQHPNRGIFTPAFNNVSPIFAAGQNQGFTFNNNSANTASFGYTPGASSSTFNPITGDNSYPNNYNQNDSLFNHNETSSSSNHNAVSGNHDTSPLLRPNSAPPSQPPPLSPSNLIPSEYRSALPPGLSGHVQIDPKGQKWFIHQGPNRNSPIRPEDAQDFIRNMMNNISNNNMNFRNQFPNLDRLGMPSPGNRGINVANLLFGNGNLNGNNGNYGNWQLNYTGSTTAGVNSTLNITGNTISDSEGNNTTQSTSTGGSGGNGSGGNGGSGNNLNDSRSPIFPQGVPADFQNQGQVDWNNWMGDDENQDGDQQQNIIMDNYFDQGQGGSSNVDSAAVNNILDMTFGNGVGNGYGFDAQYQKDIGTVGNNGIYEPQVASGAAGGGDDDPNNNGGRGDPNKNTARLSGPRSPPPPKRGDGKNAAKGYGLRGGGTGASAMHRAKPTVFYNPNNNVTAPGRHKPGPPGSKDLSSRMNDTWNYMAQNFPQGLNQGNNRGNIFSNNLSSLAGTYGGSTVGSLPSIGQNTSIVGSNGSGKSPANITSPTAAFNSNHGFSLQSLLQLLNENSQNSSENNQILLERFFNEHPQLGQMSGLQMAMQQVGAVNGSGNSKSPYGPAAAGNTVFQNQWHPYGSNAGNSQDPMGAYTGGASSSRTPGTADQAGNTGSGNMNNGSNSNRSNGQAGPPRNGRNSNKGNNRGFNVKNYNIGPSPVANSGNNFPKSAQPPSAPRDPSRTPAPSRIQRLNLALDHGGYVNDIGRIHQDTTYDNSGNTISGASNGHPSNPQTPGNYNNRNLQGANPAIIRQYNKEFQQRQWLHGEFVRGNNLPGGFNDPDFLEELHDQNPDPYSYAPFYQHPNQRDQMMLASQLEEMRAMQAREIQQQNQLQGGGAAGRNLLHQFRMANRGSEGQSDVSPPTGPVLGQGQQQLQQHQIIHQGPTAGPLNAGLHRPKMQPMNLTAQLQQQDISPGAGSAGGGGNNGNTNYHDVTSSAAGTVGGTNGPSSSIAQGILQNAAALAANAVQNAVAVASNASNVSNSLVIDSTGAPGIQGTSTGTASKESRQRV